MWASLRASAPRRPAGHSVALPGLRVAAVIAVWLGAVWLGAGPVRADGPKLDVQQFHAPATSSGYLGIDSPSVLPHLRGAAGLVFTEGHDPLLLRGSDGAVVPGGHLVQDQLWLEALGSVGLFNHFEIGLAVPVALYQGGDASLGGTDAAASLRGERGAALGDLRLDGKILALDHRLGPLRGKTSELRLALVVGLSLPTSTTALSGDDNVTGRPRLVFEWAWSRLHLGASLGAIFRQRESLLGLDVTHQLTWGLGLRLAVWRGLDALAEGRGAVGVAPPRGQSIHAVEAPAEIDLGLAYAWQLGLRLFAAGGFGLGEGYGSPSGRFILGARYTVPAPKIDLPWASRDNDHDGVLNGADQCPNDVGPSANEGCPDADFDGDGVVDRLDKCPERPGIVENKGCPDYDSDGDNIPDRLDRCPKEPGPLLGAGCPAKDSDGDGVPDAVDRCPDMKGVPQNDGCADIDSDGDGVVDRLDKCPFEAEVYNGLADEDGCPDQGAALAAVVPGQIAIFEPLQFDKLARGEKLSGRSLQVLAAVGQLLKVHPELHRVRVDGHTDNKGSAIDNLDLSLARAQLVRRYLVDNHKIDGKRLTAQGFGGARPLGDNTTPQGRARNRRVEFTIVEESK